MHYCYILYSPSRDTFYVGSTSLKPEERLERHLALYYGLKKFTSRAKDWEIYHLIKSKSKIQSLKIERHIKKMKSKKYIRNFKLYPELTTKLLIKYKDSRPLHNNERLIYF